MRHGMRSGVLYAHRTTARVYFFNVETELINAVNSLFFRSR